MTTPTPSRELRILLADAAATYRLGERLASLVHAGDLVILSGELGAGKTTLTRGLGSALGVRGAVTSPTFVIAREHPAVGDGPALLHVDAYRVSNPQEIDDLDFHHESAVTVVEWGRDRVEHLSESRLEIDLEIDLEVDGEGRLATVCAIGPRWQEADLSALAVDSG